jgi:catechol 2,3-dioxygenase-like lactoylglutathione lyase family enzyme
MTISVNGIAHIQLTVNTPETGIPFWERLCHFMDMKTLMRTESSMYCIGSRTGILVRGAPDGKDEKPFDQDTCGLHHICFRARSGDDVKAVGKFVEEELGAKMIHPAQEDAQFAPGYFSVLFEDPDGIRIEVNHVPGHGHFGEGGRLGDGGAGPADHYSEDGLLND